MTRNEVSEAGDKLLSTKEVAQLLGLPESTLRYYRSRGHGGPASFALSPKHVVYRLSECERFVTEREAATRRGGGAVA